MRSGDDGFDNGTPVSGTTFVTELPDYSILYSFRVTAVNDGGESFPSEELSVAVNPASDDIVLIVNGFDRVSGPHGLTVTAWPRWHGGMIVVWLTGTDFVARATSMILSGPRHGPMMTMPAGALSYSNDEGRIIPGNTFDFTRVHGESVIAAGKSFFSVSDEVFTGNDFDLSRWCVVDLLFGGGKRQPRRHTGLTGKISGSLPWRFPPDPSRGCRKHHSPYSCQVHIPA